MPIILQIVICLRGLLTYKYYVISGQCTVDDIRKKILITLLLKTTCCRHVSVHLSVCLLVCHTPVL